MESFAKFLDSHPEVINVISADRGIFLHLSSGKTIGPIGSLRAEGDKWLATGGNGERFLLTISPEKAKKIVTAFRQFRQSLWFHRGVRAETYLFATPEIMRRFELAEGMMRWWVDHGKGEKPTDVQEAYEFHKKFANFCKDAFFSSSEDEAAAHGNLTLSIKLPRDVYVKYLHQGAGGRGVGVSLLVPALDLSRLVSRFPSRQTATPKRPTIK